MTPSNSALAAQPSPKQRFRLNPKLSFPPAKGAAAKQSLVFLKSPRSGRVLKLGAEDQFILRGLIDGLTPAQISNAFALEFSKNARPRVITGFAAEMVTAGVLIESEEPEAPEAPPLAGQPDAAENRTGPADAPAPEPGKRAAANSGSDAPPARSDPAADETTGTGDSDNDAAPKPRLRGMAGGRRATGPVARRFKALGAAEKAAKPGPDSPADADRAEADAPETAPAVDRAAKRTRAKALGDLESLVFDEPQRPAADDGSPGPADPRIANRKVRFSQGGTRVDAPRRMLPLFNPQPLLATLSALTGWMAPLSFLLFPLMLFALMVVFQRTSEFLQALTSSRQGISIVVILLISLLTVNLFSRLAAGVVAHRRGAEVKHFGFIFILFVIPRFAIDLRSVDNLPKEDKMAVYGAALKSRLLLFALGTTYWAVMRNSATALPDIAMIIAQLGLLTFFITGMPVMPLDGYKLLSTWLDQPRLRQRAFNNVFGVPKPMRPFDPPTPAERRIFLLYVAGTVLYIGLVLSFLLSTVPGALEARFGGTGVLMFFALLLLLGLWLTSMKSSQKRAMQAMIAARTGEMRANAGAQGMDGGMPGMGGMGGGMPGMGGGGMMGRGGMGGGRPGMGGGMAAMAARGGAGLKGGMGLPATAGGSNPSAPGSGRALIPRPTSEVARPRQAALPGLYAQNAAAKRRAKWRSRLFLLVGALGILIVAFLPYRFEVGGDFVILPDARTQVNARVPGELVEIFVDEGDLVQSGDRLARLSDLDLLHDVEVTRAELAKARAQLQKLVDGATPEEIAVAREALAQAEISMRHAKLKADDATVLLERKVIAQSEAEDRLSKYESALQTVREAEARLAEVMARATDAEIAINEAEVERLEAIFNYHNRRLAQTEIVAPTAGRIVTENVTFQTGKHLNEGELFVEIEDHTTARAEVKVPESEIDMVDEGDEVRLKAWANTDREWEGVVVTVAPTAEDHEFGRIVRVKTALSNESGFFRPGMTGFAKIEGEDMLVWEAYSRLFVRFFLIEVWGWIP